MIDFGIDKLALIGAVALIVIGPERLPRVARTMGVLIGKAQRYVTQVQSEVSRSIELDELKKMKENFQTTAQDIGQTMQGSLDEAGQALSGGDDDTTADYPSFYNDLPTSAYTPPRKNWRLKRGAMPLWYKQRHGVRRHAQSGAARVARFRPNRQP
jgi:sec-independent protein translocase protein TatB